MGFGRFMLKNVWMDGCLIRLTTNRTPAMLINIKYDNNSHDDGDDNDDDSHL